MKPDCAGLRVGPWTIATGQNSPSRPSIDKMPNRSGAAASAWKLPPPKSDPAAPVRFFWFAGPTEYGPADSIEDGKIKADESLRAQGFLLED